MQDSSYEDDHPETNQPNNQPITPRPSHGSTVKSLAVTVLGFSFRLGPSAMVFDAKTRRCPMDLGFSRGSTPHRWSTFFGVGWTMRPGGGSWALTGMVCPRWASLIECFFGGQLASLRRRGLIADHAGFCMLVSKKRPPRSKNCESL